MSLVALFIAACDFTPPPCPTGDERFKPDTEPEYTYEYASLDTAIPDCEQHEFQQPKDVLFQCDQFRCVDGYEGIYCVNVDRLTEWAERVCPDCNTIRPDENGVYWLNCRTILDAANSSTMGKDP